MTFGQKIKEARLEKGLTQKELAKKIDAKHNSISNWENDQNKPDPNTIELICGVLEISPSYLLSGGDQPCFALNPHEASVIKKYRALDERGKKNIDNLLETEYQHALSQNRKEYEPKLIAAHNDGEWTEKSDKDVQMAIEMVRKYKEGKV